MRNPKLLVQSLAVTAVTALVFAGGTAAVACAVNSTPTTVNAVAASSNTTTSCNGPSAFKTISYTVNGDTVSTLTGNVTPGSTVGATFTLASSCSDTPVGIASYEAKSDHGNNQPFSLQTSYSNDDAVFTSTGSHTVSVVVPNCYFQVDFYTGTVAAPGDLYSPSGRLVGTDVGGTKSCTSSTTGSTTSTTALPTTTSTTTGSGSPVTTSTTAPATTTTTRPLTTTTVAGSTGTTTTQPGDTTVTVGGGTTSTTAPLTTTTSGDVTTTTEAPATTSTTSASVGGTSVPNCAATLSGRVVGIVYKANGIVISNMNNVRSGDVVSVTFTVLSGCREQLTFASYQATSLNTTPSGVLSQTLYDFNTGWFAPGTYTMAVNLPNCMYQTDFAEGAVITHFGPVGSNNYYAGRLLGTGTGGTPSCTSADVTTTTSTTAPSVTTTTAPDVEAESTTTTSPRPTTTTTAPDVAPAQVQADVVSTTTTSTTAPSAAVQAETVSPALATTGIDMWPIVYFGILLIGIGGFFISTARRLATRA